MHRVGTGYRATLSGTQAGHNKFCTVRCTKSSTKMTIKQSKVVKATVEGVGPHCQENHCAVPKVADASQGRRAAGLQASLHQLAPAL